MKYRISAEFSNRTVRHKFKYHPHDLDTWHSTTVRFRRNFLTRVPQLWNGLPAAVFPGQYELGTFKKRVFLHFKGWQRTCSTSGVTWGHGAAVITYHQVTCKLVCLVFFHRKNHEIIISHRISIQQNVKSNNMFSKALHWHHKTNNFC